MRKVTKIVASNSTLYWKEYPELREVILTYRFLMIDSRYVRAIPVGIVRGLYSNRLLYFQFMNEDTKELLDPKLCKRITEYLLKEFEIEENEAKGKRKANY